MAVQQTLAIIKPDATARGITGKILDRIEQEGFAVKAMKKIRLSKLEAEWGNLAGDVPLCGGDVCGDGEVTGRAPLDRSSGAPT